MVVPRRVVWRPALGTSGSSPEGRCGQIWPGMNGVLPILVAAGPSGEVENRKFRAAKDVVKMGLNGCCVGKETPKKFSVPKKRRNWLTVLGGGQAWRSATRSGRSWEPRDVILYPRNEISWTRKGTSLV
jgi:hypothetical protein